MTSARGLRSAGVKWHVIVVVMLGLSVICVSILGPVVEGKPHDPVIQANVTEMIMVAGHAVFTGEEVDSEDSWYLEESQKGQLSTYIKHIEKGVELAALNPHSAVIFSGGVTRPPAGPRSEGLSYWLAADKKKWWGSPEVKPRAIVEDFARDSMENLLFSMCRFREVFGAYPRFVTVVSYSYKRKRFVDLHREAIQFPETRFNYVGVDPPVNPYNDKVNIDKFTNDPYGCGDKATALKDKRNPYHRTAPYLLTCPAMGALLRSCGRTPVSRRSVPW
eukprot:TRINITY_DN6946_c0_g1_i1.p1 TRINITY_DN6946_c0_g1~~TRINITY_DN6946_c0_g1_i1.p1  ORF type:complete len:306 (+),score=38.16 TRINITY_DN6946_c0_g1_i1:92-919(+)